jgi:2-polyprenyl-3-methyl-5-hydroxy-6-metoxy-1,4-benzoquinol methylase
MNIFHDGTARQAVRSASYCPVCRSELNDFRMVCDDRYGYPGTYPLLKCPTCGHIALQAVFSPEQLGELYSSYYPRSELDVDACQPYQEVDGFRAWFDGLRCSTFRWVPGGIRILDIGCGFGQSLGYHVQRDCEVYGVEADENIRRVIDKYGYNVHVGLFDPDLYEEGYFDCVTMDQVIEHVTDPVKTLAGVSRVLKQGEMAILSTPNAQGWGARVFGKKWIHWHAPYHQQFFSIESMRIAANKTGFEIVDVKTITNSEWLHYQWLHLLTYPVPGKPSAFWSTRVRAGKFRRVFIRGLKIMHRLKVNHFLTRLFDLIKVGDNRVYFLRKL